MNTQAGQTTLGELIPLLIIIVLLLFFAIFCLRMAIITSRAKKERKRNLQQLKESGMTLYGCFNHVNGLNLPESMACEVFSYPALYEIKSGALKFNLLKSKVVDVTVMADTEIQKQYVSSIGGAVGGAVLFGPLGAMIGGRAKQKKSKKISYYMIITYKNDTDELKYLGFDVTNTYFIAQKFVNEFKKSNKSITSVDL